MNIKGKKVKLSYILAIVGVVLLCVAIVYALSPIIFTSQNTAHSDGTASAVLTLDDAAYSDGDVIAWGTVVSGVQEGKSLIVDNTGTEDLTVTVATQNLPVGWIMDLVSDGGYTVVAGEQREFMLRLIPSGVLPAQDWTWTSTITCTP